MILFRTIETARDISDLIIIKHNSETTINFTQFQFHLEPRHSSTKCAFSHRFHNNKKSIENRECRDMKILKIIRHSHTESTKIKQ